MAKNIIKVLRVIILITTILCKIQETQSNQSTTRKNRTSGSSPRSALRLPAVERARKFICTEPQPRAYHLKDLMDSQGLLHSQEAPNHPSYLVVRRCDEHSGCCPSPELVCMPAEGSVYFEEFDVQFRSVDTKRPRTNGSPLSNITIVAASRLIEPKERLWKPEDRRLLLCLKSGIYSNKIRVISDN